MTRVGSYASNLFLVSQMLSTQDRMFDRQLQFTNKEKSQDYAGIAFARPRVNGAMPERLRSV